MALPVGYVSRVPASRLPKPEETESRGPEVYEWMVSTVDWRQSPPRAVMRGTIRLLSGTCIRASAIWFGPRTEIDCWLVRSKGSRVCAAGHSVDIHVWGTVRYLGGQPWLTIRRVILPWEVGTVEPRYPRGVRPRMPVDPERDYMNAERWVREHWAGTGLPDGAFGKLLRSVHQPERIGVAQAARREVGNVLARSYVDHLVAQHASALTVSGVWQFPPLADASDPAVPDRPGTLLEAVPHGQVLAHSQRHAVRELLRGMDAGKRMWTVLSGEVGCGKTAVFLSVVAHVVSAGGRALIIEPTRPLAHQVESVFRRDVLSAGLIDAEAAARVTISTIGALHELRAGRVRPYDLVVLDEQQKYSVAQKLEAAYPAAHVIEVTATLIPRSQALVRMGIIPTITLDPLPIAKDIRTLCYRRQDAGILLRQVKRYLADHPGRNVLVVYPEREAKHAEAIRDVERAGAWWARRYPTAVVHGTTPDTEVIAVLDRLALGQLRVLIATTLVETGLDLSTLGVVVVGHAGRFGLATLHQIRGRVARRGGVGHCLLLCGEEGGESAWERLVRFADTTSGEEVAEIDLANRRSGDLLVGGTSQHGDPTPIPGLDIEAWLDRHASRRETAEAFRAAHPGATIPDGRLMQSRADPG